jgi:hypothetical protein
MRTRGARIGVVKRSLAGAIGAVLVALGASCGGAAQEAAVMGSESHFLTRCSASCEDGLECIGGLCTKSCLTGVDSCSELHGSAICTNQSVEPGQVAVCDVPCSGAAACGRLGDGFACDGSFCRGPSTPDPVDCKPVGNYVADERTPYVPCCAGLNEIATLRADMDTIPNPICRESGVRDYACIEGTCGDGVCEGPEAPCGCGVDCPVTYGRLVSEACEAYFDIVPPTVLNGVTITNTSEVTLYVQPYSPGCPGNRSYEPALVHVSTIGASDSGEELNIYGRGCLPNCQSVIETGWDGTGGPACPVQDCSMLAPLPWVAIPPGESAFERAKLEYVSRDLPQDCAERIVSDTLPCVTRRIPSDGAYMITVVVSASADCDPGQGCIGQSFSRPVSNYFQENHTLEISAPAQ